MYIDRWYTVADIEGAGGEVEIFTYGILNILGIQSRYRIYCVAGRLVY